MLLPELKDQVAELLPGLLRACSLGRRPRQWRLAAARFCERAGLVVMFGPVREDDHQIAALARRSDLL